MDTAKPHEPEHGREQEHRDDELIARLRKDLDDVRPGKPVEDNAPVDIDVDEVELPY